MDADEAQELINTLRRLNGETETVEVKKALDGLPDSVRATLSSFSNTAGGVILLGVDEDQGFAVVDLTSPTKLQNDLSQMGRDDLTPPLSFQTDVVEVEGKPIVVAEIPPVARTQRPVYVTNKGVSTGSYIRSGDGDRRLSQDEIRLLYAAKTQPRFDLEPVEGTGLADLDDEALALTLQRVRDNVSSFREMPRVEMLQRLLILAENSEDSPLTLAGLLAFGEYPQQFFPQLMVSVVSSDGDFSDRRFSDNAAIRGSIPRMVNDALAVIRRNIRVTAVMTDQGRIDRPDFPLNAIREALVNALLHRDYSPITRGTQVQVELTPDEITIRSPGGLYGISVDELGFTAITSSRNGALASLLSDAFLPMSREIVAEDRASGIPAVMRLARQWGLPQPRFYDSPSSFLVRMSRVPLLNPSVQTWISTLKPRVRTPESEMALAMLLVEPVTVRSLRAQTGLDSHSASAVLRGLVAKGYAIRQAGRREDQFVLASEFHRWADQPSLFSEDGQPYPIAHDSGRFVRSSPSGHFRAVSVHEKDSVSTPTTASIEDVLRGNGWITAAELGTATGLSRQTVSRRLSKLLAEGLIDSEGTPRSPKRRYRWRA